MARAAQTGGGPADPVLRALPGRLGTPCLCSVSVKIGMGRISRDRWLLTLPDTALAPGARAATLDLAAAFLGHPLDVLCAAAPRPVAIHLGCDGTGAGAIRKVYLECPPAPQGPAFLALKAGAGGVDLHRYTPAPPRAVIDGLSLPPLLHRRLLAVLEALPEDVAALEVTGGPGARRSVDINLSDLSPPSLPHARIQALVAAIDPAFDPAEARELSHVAIGLSTDGSPFVTLYAAPDWLLPEARA